ncbi:MAG: AMP-binding protein [Rhizobiales bacterium]|nr:AMP-binding protein [Hyphomicrobiales bacterium]
MNGFDRTPSSSLTRTALAEPWNRLTVTGLAQGAAAANPARAFISDCPDREAWEGNTPRRLSFGDFRRECEFFAGQIETLGLEPGNRALILMPNIVEAAIAVVGCMTAGVTPALAPIEESVETLRIAAERIGASAIITNARCEDIRPAELARQIAARVISIRCVAGFGHGLPEGVIPLDGWSEQDIDPNPNRPVRRQDQEGLVTFSFGVDGVVAHIRSEAQAICDALAVATRHKLARDCALVNTMHQAGSAALAASLLMPLFLGAQVRLVGPFKAERLRAALRDTTQATLLCPASLVPLVRESRGHEPALAALGSILCVIRPGQEFEQAGDAPPLSPLFDLLEQCLLAHSELPETIDDILGPHVHPMDSVLEAGQPYLLLSRGDDDIIRAYGFAAAEAQARSAAASEAA